MKTSCLLCSFRCRYGISSCLAKPARLEEPLRMALAQCRKPSSLTDDASRCWSLSEGLLGKHWRRPWRRERVGAEHGQAGCSVGFPATEVLRWFPQGPLAYRVFQTLMCLPLWSSSKWLAFLWNEDSGGPSLRLCLLSQRVVGLCKSIHKPKEAYFPHFYLAQDWKS